MDSSEPSVIPLKRRVGVTAMERGLSILDAFLTEGDSRGLAELARATQLPKPTVLRSLASMERMGYVVRLPDRRYKLGPRLLQLGDAYRARFRLGDHVLPVLHHLTRATSESASLHVRERDQRLSLFRVEGPQLVRDVRPPYPSLMPLDETSMGQVLTKSVWAEEAARGQGRVYFSAGIHNPLVASLSTAVYGLEGELVGALALSGPVGRLARADLDALARQLLDAARGLSRSLGGRPVAWVEQPELIRPDDQG